MYCHRADGRPAGAEILDRLPVRSCTRRGAAIDLVLTRARVVGLSGVEAVVQLAEEAVEQVSKCGRMSITDTAALVVMRSRRTRMVIAINAQLKPAAANRSFLMRRCVTM